MYLCGGLREGGMDLASAVTMDWTKLETEA
jgi:hypothetical protein